MRNNTKFVSQFLELKWVHNIFLEHFLFQNIIENRSSFFFSANGPAQREPPAHGRFRPEQLSGERGKTARLGALTQSQLGLAIRGGRAGRGHGVLASPTSRERGDRRRLTANLRPWAGYLECARFPQRDGEHGSAMHGERERARAPAAEREHSGPATVARAGRSSIEPYRRRARHTMARSEEKGRWRNGWRGESEGGAAVERERRR
jgi:hypothetical protein